MPQDPTDRVAQPPASKARWRRPVLIVAAVLLGVGGAAAVMRNGSSACQPVGARAQAYFRERILEDDVQLTDFAAVQSDDFDLVFFVSAKVEGGQMNGEIATWAKSGELDDPTDGFVKSTSYASGNMGPVGDAPLNFVTSEDDHGWAESRACLG